LAQRPSTSPVIGTVRGVPSPADQVVLASPDLVTRDLTDLTTLPGNQPSQRYSYSFDGNAQELDHILVNDNMLPRLSRYTVAHNDADFSGTFRNDPNRPERISDHDMPVAFFALPAAAPTAAAVSVSGRVVDSDGRPLAGATVAFVLRKIVGNETFTRQQFSRGFVLMQYFGYLHRNPDDAPDKGLNGYNFWLQKLNDFGGDYERAEMVEAFVNATEYRVRFGMQ